jgi:two-component system chemotaxis sensor kinase CheA
MDEIVQEFLVESHENLDQLDRDLVELEQNPQSRDLLSSVFRTIHTIKGTSGFLAYGHLEKVTHVGENLLSRLRDGALSLTPELTSALLDMVDAVRGLLRTIEETGAEGSPDHAALIARLTALQSPVPVAAVAAAAPVVAEVAAAPQPAAATPAPAKKPAARKPAAKKPAADGDGKAPAKKPAARKPAAKAATKTT